MEPVTAGGLEILRQFHHRPAPGALRLPARPARRSKSVAQKSRHPRGRRRVDEPGAERPRPRAAVAVLRKAQRLSQVLAFTRLLILLLIPFFPVTRLPMSPASRALGFDASGFSFYPLP